MLNIRFKEKTNTWPGFVDLFSNLVIILVFLLIVFVFLWTTTNVFNAKAVDKKVVALRQQNADQTEQIAQMTADEAEARKLLILSRTQMEILEAEREILKEQNAALSEQQTALEEQTSEVQNQLLQLDSEYQTTARMAAAEREIMNSQIQELQEQLAQADMSNLESQSLRTEVARLNELLDFADQRARDQEAEYIEMSNRLNKAMAEKIAEMSQYQSQFARAIRTALAGTNIVDTSGDRFVVPSDILFAKSSYSVSPEGKRQLYLIAGAIASMETLIPADVSWIIRVDGHTDRTPVIPGNARFKNNTELSLLRAQAVANELIKSGVQPRRLVPSGFGELSPVAAGNDAASLQKNRRIELRLTIP